MLFISVSNLFTCLFIYSAFVFYLNICLSVGLIHFISLSKLDIYFVSNYFGFMAFNNRLNKHISLHRYKH